MLMNIKSINQIWIEVESKKIFPKMPDKTSCTIQVWSCSQSHLLYYLDVKYRFREADDIPLNTPELRIVRSSRKSRSAEIHGSLPGIFTDIVFTVEINGDNTYGRLPSSFARTRAQKNIHQWVNFTRKSKQATPDGCNVAIIGMSTATSQDGGGVANGKSKTCPVNTVANDNGFKNFPWITISDFLWRPLLR